MKAVPVLFSSLLLASCFGAPKHSVNVQRFFNDAKERASTGNTTTKIDLRGLRFTLGALPETRANPKSTQDSILVSDVDSAIREAVQIVVTPRVGANLPDTEQPSPEFLERLQRDTEKALLRYRYVSVELGTLPDPGEPDVTPLAVPSAESIQVIEHQPSGSGSPRVLFSTYGSEKDRRFVTDLVGRLRQQLEANDIKDNFGPDDGFMEIVIKSGGQSWTLRSWHPQFEQNSQLVVTSKGVEPLNGRSRAEVLAAEPENYRNFRSLFDSLLAAMRSRGDRH
jgi:hypothetical protein